MDTSLLKRELSELVDRLGWSDTFSHLADKARDEGEKELAGTLRVLRDIMAGSMTGDEVGLLYPDDELLDLPEADLEAQYPC